MYKGFEKGVEAIVINGGGVGGMDGPASNISCIEKRRGRKQANQGPRVSENSILTKQSLSKKTVTLATRTTHVDTSHPANKTNVPTHQIERQPWVVQDGRWLQD